jgi:signal transduction histidine kinase
MHDRTAQKELEKEIANISTKERERLGQELHDGIGQQLTGLNMMAVSIKRSLANRNYPEAEQIDEMIDQLQKATKEARALSRGLMPVPVTPEGLRQALTLLARDVKKKTNIDCHFEAHDTGDIEHQIEDRTVAMQIYQITQEAVNNAVKHAQPSKISILLKTTPESSELTISDNGCGFQVDAANSEGMGIRIMRYRAGVIGYNLAIESTPGKGTIVRCKHVTT